MKTPDLKELAGDSLKGCLLYPIVPWFFLYRELCKFITTQVHKIYVQCSW